MHCLSIIKGIGYCDFLWVSFAEGTVSCMDVCLASTNPEQEGILRKFWTLFFSSN